MDVRISKISGHGDYKSECVLLEVVADCDIGAYMLADSTYTSENRISNKVRHTFWFPDKKVKKGDFVSLWTQGGTDTTTTNDAGKTVHRFYWGLKQAVWNDDGDCALLFLIKEWTHFKVASTKK